VPQCPRDGFALGFGEGHAARDQLLKAEREEVEHFGVGERAPYAVALERAREHVPPPVDLREQDRIDDPDRDLVA
jgi:hypothetical protein